MKFNLKKVLTALGLASTIALVGCGEQEAAVVDNNKVTIGVMAGSEAQVAEIAAKVAKEKYGLEVTLVTFSDYITPNAALDEGSIDANAFQHKPYLDQQIADRGYKFAIAGNTLVYPIAGYSNKIKTLDELKDGDLIALSSVPSSLGRSLVLLERQGLITLKEGTGLNSTVLDIVSSEKNLKIIELEPAQLPRSLDDVALAVINTTFASAIDLTPAKDGLFVEDKDSPFVNLVVARSDNVQAQNVQNFVKAYQTEEVYNAAFKTFKGGIVKGW
ncbi:MAG: MetQ/NlpA family lipoprotein [Gammaproteobacteria bacterium]|nr:MetQ/NlpA family lipoprotein [Gammaproteobacteria bacterium]